MAKAENEVQKKMMDIVKRYGGYVYKNNQNAFSERGRPDLTACIPTTTYALRDFIKDFDDNTPIGLFMGIECKVNKNEYDSTLAQEVVGRQIKRAHGLWLSTDDVAFLDALLRKLTGGKL